MGHLICISALKRNQSGVMRGGGGNTRFIPGGSAKADGQLTGETPAAMIIGSAHPRSALTKSRLLDSIGRWRFGPAFGDDDPKRERGLRRARFDLEMLRSLARLYDKLQGLLSETGFDTFVD
jgi:hypothetical protein